MNFPADVLVCIAEYLTWEPICLARFAGCNKRMHTLLANAHQHEQKAQVDRIWIDAANRFCYLTMCNGPLGPQIGSGDAYRWFRAVVAQRCRQTMHTPTQQLQAELAGLGDLNDLAERDLARGRQVIQELAERGVAPTGLDSFYLRVAPGQVLSCIDTDHPIVYVESQHADGCITLRCPFDNCTLLRTRGQLHIAKAAITDQYNTLPDRLRVFMAGSICVVNLSGMGYPNGWFANSTCSAVYNSATSNAIYDAIGAFVIGGLPVPPEIVDQCMALLSVLDNDAQ